MNILAFIINQIQDYLAACEQCEDIVRPDVQIDQVLADPLDQNGIASRPCKPVVPNAKNDDIRHCNAT